MTLLYWEWHLIPNSPLRSIFAWFLEQFVKDLVSWGSPGKCSMMVTSWEMLPGFCPARFGALFCSVVFDCQYLKPLDRAVSGAQFLTGGVFECDIAHCWSVAVLCMLYKIRCNLRICYLDHLMMCYLDRMCQCVSHAVPWSHIGILMCHLAAEPRSTTGLLFHYRWNKTNNYHWQVSRAGPMLFYWPKFLRPYYSLQLFFLLSSSCLWVGIVGLWSLDW